LSLVVASLLFLWALGGVQQKSLKFFWSPLYIPLALFLILGMLQYGAGLELDKWETRTALLFLATNLTFFFLAAQFFGEWSLETRSRYGWAVLLFVGGLGLFSVLQFASGAQKIYWIFDAGGRSFFGPYRNPDHYAGLMEMLVPVGAFYLAERRRFGTDLILPILAATIGVTSLLLSGSRGGLLALFAEMLIAIVIGWGRRSVRVRQSRGRLRFAVPALAVPLAALLLFAWVDTGYVAKRFGAVASPADAWTEWSSFRKSVTLDALRMLRDHPFLGVGLGNFETVYPQYQSFPTDLTVDYVHNDYAQAMAETGLVGTVLMISALLLFFRLSFRQVGERLRVGGNWIQLGAAVGCCGLLVHSFFDFNLHIPANAAWFAVLAAIATSDARPLSA